MSSSACSSICAFQICGPVVNRLTLTIDRHADRHVFDAKRVDGFHAEVLKRHHLRFGDSLRHQIRRAAHRHKIDRTVFFDRFHRYRTALRPCQSSRRVPSDRECSP